VSQNMDAPSVEERLRRAYNALVLARASLSSDTVNNGLDDDDLLEAANEQLDDAIGEIFSLRGLPVAVMNTRSPAR
jgi:hypothetical protein